MNHGRISPQIAQGLLSLQKRIKLANIPSSKIDESLTIATWNIREFGRRPRREAALHYIAEIIGQFDLVGIVELRENLEEVAKVLQYLGPYWRIIYSDAMSDAGGNHERLGFIYDKRAVTFTGLAAEADAPRKQRGLEYLPETSFWRSPYMVSFRAGNFDFVILSAHIRWGDDLSARGQEIEMLADWIEGKRRGTHAEDKDLIVVGDFNINQLDDDLYKKITKHGLCAPEALRHLSYGSDLAKKKRYDQILHYPRYPSNFSNLGGILDYYIDESYIPELFPDGLTKAEFTYQLSDHLPLWTQINTDIEGFRLEQVLKQG